jgi:hypothetical protein
MKVDFMERQRGVTPAFSFLSILFLLFIGLSLCYAHSIHATHQEAKTSLVRMVAVSVVGSADLAINNAARYIRHVSLTDVSTAFQDCPGCLDYFPEAMSVNPPDFPGFVTRFEGLKP